MIGKKNKTKLGGGDTTDLRGYKIDHIGNGQSRKTQATNPLATTGKKKKKKKKTNPATAYNGCFHSVVLFCV